MTSARDIENDATWLPHRIDVGTRQIEFLKIERDSLSGDGFLADRDPPASGRISLSWDDVQAMKPETGPIHFIFHTAFCRSTLLVRAVDAPGVAAGLSEPGIIPSLTQAGDAMRDLIGPVTALLARPWQGGEAVIVKPTNHANMLLPALLQACPDSKAILMTNSLAAFLRSVARKGLMGRNWARKLFLELQTYAGMDFGMDPRESFALTDMQTAGLAWFLNQRFFGLLQSGQAAQLPADRFRVLDGDRFNEEREKTLSATFDHFEIKVPGVVPSKLASSDVFARHSKLGGAYSEDHAGAEDTVLEQEIDQVGQWLGIIAQQAQVKIPLEQSLF